MKGPRQQIHKRLVLNFCNDALQVALSTLGTKLAVLAVCNPDSKEMRMPRASDAEDLLASASLLCNGNGNPTCVCIDCVGADVGSLRWL